MTEKTNTHKEIVSVLVEKQDRDRIYAEAEKARLSVSSFCRTAILDKILGGSQ